MGNPFGVPMNVPGPTGCDNPEGAIPEQGAWHDQARPSPGTLAEMPTRHLR
jgi:hypothetical protein